MNSIQSDENNSNSGTSESERQNFREKLRSYKYENMPKRDYNYRLQHQKKDNITITTNLFEIKLIDNYHKFTLFSINILPEIAEDNFVLLRKVFFDIVYPNLPKSFKKNILSGRNLFSFITEGNGENKDRDIDYQNIEISGELNNSKYKIKLEKIKEISFKHINDFNGKNQQIKSIIENMLRNIIMSNPKVITFHDRTIFEIDPKKIINVDNTNKENIYQGYISSSHITESGLFMLINSRSKYISGKTALQKMLEIRKKYVNQNMPNRDIFEKIREYFYEHKTVLTTYGSLKGYKIKDINFDKNPNNTSVKIKNINGDKKNISIINYYKNQYNIDIRDKNQPLLIAENNLKIKKLLPSDKNSLPSEDDYVIYLIPELVYITGIEEDDTENNKRNKNRNIVNKTKMGPSEKMIAINNGINKLINSQNQKKIKLKNGQEIMMKSPKELCKEWGINIGNNLTFPGRIISQPKLYFKGDNKNNEEDKIIYPNNGIFRADSPFESVKITNDNIFFVYDKSERNSNHRKLFEDIMKKCRYKSFEFSEDFHPNKVLGFGLDNTNNWENINHSLRKINLNSNKNSFGIIFCSRQLEKYYDKLKHFFLQQYNIPTQHVITKKLEEPRRGNSIMFNLVDQINIKMGGINYYINFKNEGIIKSGQVYLIIGLDSKYANKKITYSMTSTTNSKLNNIVTQEETIKDANDIRQKTLQNMFKNALKEVGYHCPHSPDFIIIYRQGGNDIKNKMLTIKELDNFTSVLSKYREKYKDEKKFNFKNSKLYYICCNLKTDLKFFETKRHDDSIAYYNPKSGLIIDDYVTQKNKYEFYLQPQYVNQGTATTCHYQIMYYDKAEKEEDELTIENLEKLSFYLSFYYWTWSGAIRTPAMLKLSNTAMGFYLKVLDNKSSCFFKTPTFI